MTLHALCQNLKIIIINALRYLEVACVNAVQDKNYGILKGRKAIFSMQSVKDEICERLYT